MVQKEDFPALFTGMMATLGGIGIARFAYTPLLSELVQQDWFSDAEAVYLGAANLLGYLIGALSAHSLSERISVRKLMSLSFVAIALSFILCAQPGGFVWFFVWRLIAGVAGAILMVIGPATALSRTEATHRTGVASLVFAGIGLGAVLSAFVVPLFLKVSLSSTWIALGGLTLLVWLVFDQSFAKLKTPNRDTITQNQFVESNNLKPVVLMVMAAYALDAVGFIPHTIFWVDYLAREQMLGTSAASAQWAVFGVGAVFGPLAAGILAKRFGWNTALSMAFIFKAAAVAIPIISISLVSRTLSSFIVGAMVPALVALTSGRIAELVGPSEHKRYWGYATAVFAFAQALSGYGMSTLYSHLGSYYVLFAIGSTFLILGFALNAFSNNMKEQNKLIQ